MTDAVVPPQALDAEERVLGAMLLSPKAVDAVSEAIAPGDFYRKSHATIYAAAVSLYSRGEPVDAVTVVDELERRGELEDVGGRVRINELAALVPATSNVRHYARIVTDTATRRHVIRAGQEIARLGFEQDGLAADEMANAAAEIALSAITDRARPDLVTPADLLGRVISELGDLQGRGGGVIGLPSGLTDLDRITAGLQPGNLVVLGARPSVGKSALALGIVRRTGVRATLPTLVFSLEMSRDEVMHRLLAAEAIVDLHKLRTGRLDVAEWGKVHHAASRLQGAPIHVDDSPMPGMVEIRARARALRARHPDLALVVVDYLQLIHEPGDESRVQEVSKITRALKALARDLHVPVLALSQLSRNVESRHDKRPMLADLRESGTIEQDADIVIFVYRDEVYYEDTEDAGVAELHVAKARNGPTGTARVAFYAPSASFLDLARHE